MSVQFCIWRKHLAGVITINKHSNNITFEERTYEFQKCFSFSTREQTILAYLCPHNRFRSGRVPVLLLTLSLQPADCLISPKHEQWILHPCADAHTFMHERTRARKHTHTTLLLSPPMWLLVPCHLTGQCDSSQHWHPRAL